MKDLTNYELLDKFEMERISEKAKIDEYNRVINSLPNSEWIETDERGHASVGIARMKWIMVKVFGQSRVEITKEPYLILNSICSTVRIHYLHPVTREWTFQDGTGAVEIQVKTSNAYDYADLNIITPGSIESCVAACVSMAEKNAMKKIGVIFGSNIGRVGTGKIDYSGLTVEEKTLKDQKDRLKMMINGSKNIQSLKLTEGKVIEINDLELLRIYNQKKKELTPRRGRPIKKELKN